MALRSSDADVVVVVVDDDSVGGAPLADRSVGSDGEVISGDGVDDS